jgi:hypothetical protein
LCSFYTHVRLHRTGKSLPLLCCRRCIDPVRAVTVPYSYCTHRACVCSDPEKKPFPLQCPTRRRIPAPCRRITLRFIYSRFVVSHETYAFRSAVVAVDVMRIIVIFIIYTYYYFTCDRKTTTTILGAKQYLFSQHSWQISCARTPCGNVTRTFCRTNPVRRLHTEEYSNPASYKCA